MNGGDCMKCPHCGKEIPKDARFCGFCGKEIQMEEKEPEKNPEKSDSNGNHGSGKGKWRILLSFVIFAAAVTGVVLALYGGKKPAENSNKKKEENQEQQEAYYGCFTKDDIRYENGVRYVDSRLLLTAYEDTDSSEIEEIVNSYGAKMLGYIPLTGDYQIQFQEEKSYEELVKLITELKEKDEIYEVTLETVMEVQPNSIDYTTDPWISARYPEDTSGSIWTSWSPDGANWWAEAIMMPKVWNMDQDFSLVNVGLIDSYFDRTNEDLTDAFAQDGIIGQDDMDVSHLYEEAVNAEQQKQEVEPKQSSGALSHGSVDAGIIGARNNGFGICGISQNANLYGVSLYGNSDHWNISLMGMKYAIAALLEKNVKVINISMGWDTLLFAAQQEDTKEDDRTDAAVNELNQLRDTMEKFLKRCLKKYDFLIVKSAGNNSGYDYIKVDVDEEHPYGYRKAEQGDSDTSRIRKICDARYDIFGSIADDEVKAHILVVGAVNLTKNSKTKSDGNTDTIGSLPSGAATDTTVVDSSSRVSKWYDFRISNFSNTGERVNLYAPGGCIMENGEATNVEILSDYPTNITEYMQGTSQATPMVAGTAALIWGVHPEFTAEQVRQILLSSAEKEMEGENSYLLLNAYRAVKKAQETDPDGTEKEKDRFLLLGYTYINVENEDEMELVEAEITITGKDDGTEQKIDLDNDQTFSVFLAKGGYTIKAKAEGYEETSQDITITEEQTNFVAILLNKTETPEESQENIFARMPSGFEFSSGAGGWGTHLELNTDGTFKGTYSDSELGDTGEGYPNGSIYLCNFEGKFTTPKQIDTYTYTMKLEYLNTEGTKGEEYIQNGMRYVMADAYGFDHADEFRIYLPGIAIRDLPDGFVSWLYAFLDVQTTEILPYYGIYNVDGEEGFVSWNDFYGEDNSNAGQSSDSESESENSGMTEQEVYEKLVAHYQKGTEDSDGSDLTVMEGSVNGSVYTTSVRCGMPGNPSASQMLYEVQVNMTNGDVTQTRVLTDNKVTTFNIR
ncbi:MAG: S8 family serine peptidase [Blautia sp.]